MPIRVSEFVTAVAEPSSVASLVANPINLIHSEQEEENWCWAACTKMISKIPPPSDPDQCDIAGTHFPTLDCCANTQSCDQPIDVVDVNPLLQEFGIGSVFEGSDKTFQEIKDEITANRPVLIGYVGSPGHLVIVVGWLEEGEDQYVWLHDPKSDDGPDDYSFAKMQSGLLAYPNWSHTWIELEKV